MTGMLTGRNWYGSFVSAFDGFNLQYAEANLKHACNEYGRRAEFLVVKIRKLQASICMVEFFW